LIFLFNLISNGFHFNNLAGFLNGEPFEFNSIINNQTGFDLVKWKLVFIEKLEFICKEDRQKKSLAKKIFTIKAPDKIENKKIKQWSDSTQCIPRNLLSSEGNSMLNVNYEVLFQIKVANNNKKFCILHTPIVVGNKSF